MIPDSEVKKQARRLKIGEALTTKKQGRFLGLTLDEYIKYFFSGNGAVAIIVLVLIMVFLFREGAGFVPMNAESLQLYRKAGLEYADVIRNQVSRHEDFSRDFNLIRQMVMEHLIEEGASSVEARSESQYIKEYSDRFEETIQGHAKLAEELKTRVVEARDQAIANSNLKEALVVYQKQGDEETAGEIKGMIEPVDFEAIEKYCKSTIPRHEILNKKLAATIPQVMAEPLELPTEEARVAFAEIRENISQYVSDFPLYIVRAQAWDPSEDIPVIKGFTAFITGKNWTTASYWQDFYGILPLFTGSLMISTLALCIAVPFSIAAGIYVNQLAGPRELKIIKPYIEFIEALPSIVLGFFGIAVLGSALRNVSQVEWLAWFPGFPMSERLTIATAGILLALMAVPTIFTLVEDALNNVPRHYVEASYALGANRMQTIFRILIPAALSGIVAAVLLGLGRVIGETMVVLLCAGGAIIIPDFTEGIGAFFQPAHTMTGIIAQELGEVELGSLHYRALFMVGMVLFCISLLLNYCSQFIIKKFRISE